VLDARRASLARAFRAVQGCEGGAGLAAALRRGGDDAALSAAGAAPGGTVSIGLLCELLRVMGVVDNLGADPRWRYSAVLRMVLSDEVQPSATLSVAVVLLSCSEAPAACSWSGSGPVPLPRWKCPSP